MSEGSQVGRVVGDGAGEQISVRSDAREGQELFEHSQGALAQVVDEDWRVGWEEGWNAWMSIKGRLPSLPNGELVGDRLTGWKAVLTGRVLSRSLG